VHVTLGGVCGVQEDNMIIYDRTNQLDCVLGIPGISLPIGLASDGLPLGIMFYGKPG
jgi:Asp-tRNA(Asn)/Glu-tRNA(Gln) amidotransferase A subunit family amidase